MELRHLRYFVAVAEARHFGRAARALHVSQPTVSQQILALEEELGAPLLVRGPRKVSLTAEGEAFLRHALRALEDVAAGAREVSSLRTLDAGLLRVGYPPSLRGLVTPALRAVHEAHPRVSLVAHEAVVPVIERRLSAGQLDIALGYLPVRDESLDATPLVESRLALLAPRSHPLSREPHAPARRLSHQPLALLSRGLRARSRIDAYLARARVSPRVILESNSVAALLAHVRDGLALTILPDAGLSEDPALALIRLSPQPEGQHVALLLRRGAPPTPAASALARALAP